MRSTFKRRTTIIVAAVAALGLGGGLAYAYWSSTGAGDGTAGTGTSAAFTVDSTASADPALTPGGPAQSVPISVTNPSSGTQTLTSVVITVANADGSAWTAVAGCSAADYAVGTPAITYGPIAGGATVNGTVAVSMNNLPSNQDACKNVVAPLYIVAS